MILPFHFQLVRARILVFLIVFAALCGCGRNQKPKSDSTAYRSPSPSRSSSATVAISSSPFVVVETPSHPTLFEALNPSAIGIEFVHEWTPPGDSFMEIRSYASTAGVAIGDYDSDGLPDLFLASQKNGGKLYRNRGNWKFQDVTTSANVDVRGMWATGVSFVDINNDSHLDLAICGYDCPNRIYMNQGNGLFIERASELDLDYEGASTMMSFADYDRDGDLDVYLLTNRLPPKQRRTGKATKVKGKVVIPEHLMEETGVMNLPNGEFHFMPAGQFDYLLRNDGASFSDVTTAAGMDKRNHHGLSATWWDPNDDGWPDLFVANDFMWPDHFYVHNGSRPAPAFEDRVKSSMPHVPWFSMGSDVGDFNNDGRMDLIATDMSPTSHYRSKLTMGDMSTFSWFLDQADPPQYMRNTMLVNTGTDRFQEVAQMAGVANSDWTWSVRAEDFDCDGLTDLFMTTGMTRDFENADLSDELERLQSSARNEKERAEIASEFWRDKPQLREANVAFRNRGDLRFDSVGKAWGIDEKSVGFGCATGDLDGDGDLDIVVNNFSASPSIYRNLAAENSGATSNRIKVNLVGRQSNRFGIGAHVELKSGGVTQTRYVTLARGYMSSSEPAVFFGMGKHATVESLKVRWPSGAAQEFTNLSASQCYTITESVGDTTKPDAKPLVESAPLFIESDIVKGIRHREQAFDDFARQPLLPNRLSQLGPGIAWGDVNGDGVDDFFIGGARGEPGRPHLMRNGQFRIYPKQLQAFIHDADREDMGALFFDADRDDDLDLYVVSGSIECEPDSELLRDRLYLNDGEGRFERSPNDVLPDLRFSGSCVVGADYDRDGDVDLFVGGRTVPGEYPTSPRSCLLENRSSNGKALFADVTAEKSIELERTGMVTGAIWSDANGDGWVDLLLVHEWGPVAIFLNNEGVLRNATDDAGLAGRLGWFNGIHGGDVDGDGDIDYVVTNFGNNTKYHASVDSPVEIYYGVFDSSGQKRIIEAVHKHDRLFPVRGKSCSQNAMPFLLDKFQTYHDFALQGVEGVYSRSRLDEALRLEVNGLESGILINNGDAQFAWMPLPRITQVAPGFGVSVTDFNLDGQLDMMIGQNFYGPQRETGRMNGGVGQFLVGTGDGRFLVVAPHESGIVVADDAKGLTVTDLNADSKPDIVVSTNNGPVRAFLNQAETRHRTLSVRLKGGRGNQSAFGATLTLRCSNGERLVAEVYGGGGYLSQSATVQTFAIPRDVTCSLHVAWPNGDESMVPIGGESVVTVVQPEG